MLFVSALNVSHDNVDDDDNGAPKAIADQRRTLTLHFPSPMSSVYLSRLLSWCLLLSLETA